MYGYPSTRVVKIENAFLVEYSTQEDPYEHKTYSYNSMDGVINKLMEVFKQDGK